jgi:hypothetical protein
LVKARSLAARALAPTTPTNATTASRSDAPTPTALTRGDSIGPAERRSAAASSAAAQASAARVTALISQSQSTPAWTRNATNAARATGTRG